jgi:hypothetical protein
MVVNNGNGLNKNTIPNTLAHVGIRFQFLINNIRLIIKHIRLKMKNITNTNKASCNDTAKIHANGYKNIEAKSSFNFDESVGLKVVVVSWNPSIDSPFR